MSEWTNIPKPHVIFKAYSGSSKLYSEPASLSSDTLIAEIFVKELSPEDD